MIWQFLYFSTHLKSNNNWNLERELLCSSNDALCNHITSHDAAKDIHHDCMNLRMMIEM